jgi:hypothetical protein
MDVFIHWAGFAGAWLLVAGPLFQAAVELRDEDLDRDQFERVKTDLPPQERISGWWWLLPPVAYYKSRKRNDRYQKAMMTALPPAAREQFVGFMNKATGWFTVAAGAFLIALKETWELVELYELPVVVYWVAVVVLSIAAVSNTVARMLRADEILHVDEPDYAEKRKAERAAAMEKRRREQGKPPRPQRTKRTPPPGDA